MGGLTMANKNLFKQNGIRNEAGAVAYNLAPKDALSQLALTGCLNQTFYVNADAQLSNILNLCNSVDPEFVAKLAVYSRERGYMKDVPALLCVWLAAKRQTDLLFKVFSRVIDNGKMLRNFVQILRSGVTGRKSMGTVLKRLIASWFNSRTSKEVFSQSVGNDPSFAYVLLLSHAKPLDKGKEALYKWFFDKEYNEEDLPAIVQDFENFKKGRTKELPDVPHEMLTALPLGQMDWCQMAARAGWHWLRMNLNTMQRHHVFDIADMANLVAEKIKDKNVIKRARVFPYQLLTTYKNAYGIPSQIMESIQDAMEVATENVPELPGDGYVLLDVSGSMSSPITGKRTGVASKVRCVDVAGLIASTVLRKNPSSCIVPFADNVKQHSVNPRDTVMTNADKLANLLGGGTNCSAPLKMLNDKGASGDWVILVSDNQSWADTLGLNNGGSHYNKGGHTQFMAQWDMFKKRNPHAKLVAIDIQPYMTTQAQSRDDILNVAGFGDLCFDIINDFFVGELNSMADKVEKVEL